MNSLKAVVVGAYGEWNLGDDALMVACRNIVSDIYRPEEVGFVCTEASYVPRWLPGIRVLPRTPESLAAGELLVYGGGTQFFSFPHTQGGSLWKGRIAEAFRHPSKIPVFVRRKLFGVRSHVRRRAALGIGVGPFVPGSRKERETRELLTALDFVSVRDPLSYDICREWNIKNVVLETDLCFMPHLWSTSAPDDAVGAGPGCKVAVVVRDWHHTDEGAAYSAPLLKATDELVAAGMEVVFFSFCKKTDSNWLARLDKSGRRCVVWNPMVHTLSTFLNRLASCDCIVTARYHGAVLAAVLGRPVVCIEVEQKLAMAAEMLHAGARLWAQPFVAGELVSTVRELVERRDHATRGLAAEVANQRELVRRMTARFSGFVDRSSNVIEENRP